MRNHVAAFYDWKWGRKMSGRAILPDEIKLMTSEMQRQLSRLEEMIYDLDNYMKEIIQTEKLAGETAKNFINHIENHLKVINGIKYLTLHIKEACEKLDRNIGYDNLIEDDIINQINELNSRNLTINNEINDIDDALDKWYIKLFLSSNYEKLKNYYYFSQQNNKNMIETLKRKLQKIDEIEKNIVNLFDNGILSNINYAVDILKQSYESKDFSPITYPDVMLFYKLGNLKIDSVSLQGDRIGLNTDFITIIDDNGMLLEKFGGDQSWLDDSVSDSSCGVIAIVNTYLYMTGQTTITKKDYIELCKRFLNENKFDNILIEKNFGALPTTMCRYLERLCIEQENLKIHAKWNCFSNDNEYQTMKDMLKNNIPVVWGLYSMNSCLKLYQWDKTTESYIEFTTVSSHYVVVTGIYEIKREDGSIKKMVEISSWGKKCYVDYDEYEVFKRSVLSQTYEQNPNLYMMPTIDGEGIVNNIGSSIIKIEIN